MVALLLVLACHGDGPAPTYYADVRPILDNTCARCHTDGGVAPVSFDQPDDVIALADLIVANTQAGTMPPPAPDPACHDYTDSDRMVLSDADKATLKAWVDGGKELGDPADAPAAPEEFHIGPFDVEYRAAEAFTPTFASGTDEYRCFAFDSGNDADKFIVGLEALPDRSSIVHHVVLFQDDSGTADLGATDGFACEGFGNPDWSVLAAYGPGEVPTTFPEGAGMRLQAHARLVLQMHYFDSGDSGPDNTGYGLILADQVTTEIYNIGFGILDPFTIPAGETDHVESYDAHWSPLDGTMTIYGVWAHMHQLGKAFEYDIDHPDDTNQCVVKIDGWNFHNQPLAMFDEPIQVTGGDNLHIRCHYDNSSGNPANPSNPPVDAHLGESSLDEMCFGFTYASFR
jgi:hypothetical protein